MTALHSPSTQRSAGLIEFADALARFEAGDRETLVAPLEQATGARSTDPRIWHLHALVLRDLDRHAEALPSLRRAAQMAPGSINIAHALARTLYEAGLPCVNAYASALRLAPGDAELLIGMSAALVAEGRIDDAIAGLARSVALSPQWAGGHVQLAKLRWMSGERAGFTRSFDEALAKLPRHFELWRELINALTHAGYWGEVMRVIADGRRALGDQPLFDHAEAIAASESGNRERADALFNPMQSFADGGLQLWRTRHLLRSGRPREAAEALEPWLSGPHARDFWPYASIAWRMTGDARSQWLERDGSLVKCYDITDQLPPLEDLAETLRRRHQVGAQPLEQSVRGGTQTDGNLFQHIDPVIGQVREAVRRTVSEYAASLPPLDDRHPLLSRRANSVRFSGAWSVRLTAGGHHANHVHPAGWISSALYVVLPSDTGAGEAGFLTLGEPQAELSLDLAPIRKIEPKPGTLVLFPSWMWHGTRPFGAGERMTIAFDVAIPE